MNELKKIYRRKMGTKYGENIKARLENFKLSNCEKVEWINQKMNN